MREFNTLQAAMRFGRDGHGATVYVHTNTLPEWVPLAGKGRVLQTWSDRMKQVVDAAEDLDRWRTTEIVDHPAVEIGERQVFDHLNTLAEKGVLDRRINPDDGRGYVWRDTGLHRVNEHGEVELDPVEVDNIAESIVAEVARSSIYTWEFRKTPSQTVAEDKPPHQSVSDTSTIEKDTAVRDSPPPG